MSSTKTLQFFYNELESHLTPESYQALVSGDTEAVGIVSKAWQGIDPTSGDHRQAVARFRGSLADRAAMTSRSYNGWAIPVGTELALAVGANGVTVAGNAVFMAVDPKVLVPANSLGVGSSAELRDAFTAWEQKQA